MHELRVSVIASRCQDGFVMGSEGLTRRQLIAAGLGVAGAAAVGGCEKPAGEGSKMAKSTTRMPVVFLPHGGGPWPWIKEMYDAALAGYLALSSGNSAWASVALYAAGRLAADRHDPSARSLLETYLRRFPNGANAGDARDLLTRTGAK